ncbi:MAG: outer membrane beta-barrel protein [Bacteroidales bacterium]|jgi:hypothetical protein
MKVVYSKIISVPVSGILLFLLAFLLIQPTANSQIVNETAKKKISIGFGMFNDFVLNIPSGIKIRTINQGVNVFGLYNVPFGKSNFGFSLGLGLTAHNIYGNFLVNKVGDTTKLVKISPEVSYKRSKMTIVYLEIPLEFNLKTKSKVNVALGIKVGYLIGSHTKYVGNVTDTSIYIYNTASKVRIKEIGIPNLEKFCFGPTFRFGYRWISIDGQYMLTTLFSKSHGPDMYPISVGLVLMPF